MENLSLRILWSMPPHFQMFSITWKNQEFLWCVFNCCNFNWLSIEITLKLNFLESAEKKKTYGRFLTQFSFLFKLLQKKFINSLWHQSVFIWDDCINILQINIFYSKHKWITWMQNEISINLIWKITIHFLI